jgi:release factor glutamine methyltransferase
MCAFVLCWALQHFQLARRPGLKLKTLLHRHSHGHKQGLSTVKALPIALIDRKGTHNEIGINVRTWRAWARALAKTTVEENFSSAEDPNLDELFKEIDWLIEDNIDNCPIGEPGSSITNHIQLEEGGKYSFQLHDGLDEVLILRVSLSEMKELWRRRLQERLPLQYLTNIAYWRDLTLLVTPAVLIPRPETELIIDFATQCFYDLGNKNSRNLTAQQQDPWLDLGTGSGAIAISLAKSFELNHFALPRFQIYAVDISSEACLVAKYNVHKHGVSQVVKVINGSWFDPFDSSKKFSGIISNPPYIPTEQLSSLQLEVRGHEPTRALDGGKGVGVDCLILLLNSRSLRHTDFS